MTGVEPVYGLYTAFFGVLFYMIFGTSQYISIGLFLIVFLLIIEFFTGSFAIISLMTGVSCREIQKSIDAEFLATEISYLSLNDENINLGNLNLTIPRLQVAHAELVQAITLTSGLIQIIMAILRVEFLASYLSDQLVNGFCTGAAVHVIIVQMSKLVQVNGRKFSGVGYLFKVF